MAKSRPLPSVDMLRGVLGYDAETGDFRWLRNVGNVPAGTKAGTVTTKGYLVISLKKQRYLAHRLAWLIAYGTDPGMLQIDHINGNKIDNRLVNLRLATNSENLRNVGYWRSNSSGYKGVVWSKASEKWCASITVNRKKYYLGLFVTREEAHEAYVKAACKLHGRFARVS